MQLYFNFFLSISYQVHKTFYSVIRVEKTTLRNLSSYLAMEGDLPCASVSQAAKCRGLNSPLLMPYLKVMLEGDCLQGQYLLA